jgi:beta-glucanase (GH16 family)
MTNSALCSFIGLPTWSEEFDGEAGTPLDPTVWNFSVSGPDLPDFNANSNINDISVAYQDGNSNAVLQVNEISSGVYTGPQISTGPLLSGNIGGPQFSVQYPAYIETRAKLPYASGIWPGTLYLVGTEFINVGFPEDGEVDFSEQFGSTSTDAGSTNTAVHQSSITTAGALVNEFSTIPWSGEITDFHRYGVLLQENLITFFIDGTQVLQQTPASLGSWGLNIPFFIAADLWVGASSSAAGSPIGTTFPQQLLIDYIRVWQT